MFVEAFRTPLLTFHNEKDTPLWQSDMLVSFSTFFMKYRQKLKVLPNKYRLAVLYTTRKGY